MTLRQLRDLVDRIEEADDESVDWDVVIGAWLPEEKQAFVGQICGIAVEPDNKRVVLDLGNWGNGCGSNS